MRVFLTGATGFIGTATLPELLAAGHEVIGLTRSDEGARRLSAAGVEPFLGSLEDPEGLARGAERADAVIHLAFDHDFAHFAANCEKDRRVIASLAAALEGSDRPLVITSGTGMGAGAPGEPAREDVFASDNPNPRVASEREGRAWLARGVNVSFVRLPQVHDTRKQGLITFYIAAVRERGVAAYVGEGQNRWSAAHVSDVARLYRLALARAERGATYHAVAEEGVPVRAIAETVGKGLRVPVRSVTPDEAPDYFGWLALFAALDLSASSADTRARLGWTPTGPGLIEDLEHVDYATLVQ